MLRVLQRWLYYTSFIFRTRRFRTVRYAFPVLITAFSLIGAAVLLQGNASYLRIESSRSAVQPGETFSLDLYAGAHVPVNAINIEITYPDEVISVESIDIGKSVITIWTQDPHVEGDRIIFSGGTYRKGFIGEHLIATIDVKAREDGTAVFSAENITFLAGDGTGEAVSLYASKDQTVAVAVNATEGTLTGTVDVYVYTDIDADGVVTMTDIRLLWQLGTIKTARLILMVIIE
ncbi:MAG: hypothetical protein R3B69_00505 [Candidatus Paceibacterota bacterium]